MEDGSKREPLEDLNQNISIIKSIFRKLLGHYQSKENTSILKNIFKNFEKNRKKLEPMLRLEKIDWTMPIIERFLYKYVKNNQRISLRVFTNSSVCSGDSTRNVKTRTNCLSEKSTTFCGTKRLRIRNGTNYGVLG